jgi:hypothetical protein
MSGTDNRSRNPWLSVDTPPSGLFHELNRELSLKFRNRFHKCPDKAVIEEIISRLEPNGVDENNVEGFLRFVEDRYS